MAAFVESGQLFVNSRVFIDRVDERRFSNVTLINTQTAFLLADLNNTTQQENLSVYYTQDQSLFEFQTQANRRLLEPVAENSRIDECDESENSSNKIDECDSRNINSNSQLVINQSATHIDSGVDEDMSRSKEGSTQLVSNNILLDI